MPKFKTAGTYCSGECYRANGPRGARKERTVFQRVLVRHGHPLARPTGQVAENRFHLYEAIGGGTHPCHWCGRPVTWRYGLGGDCLIADHLNWDRNDNRPENLVPSCIPCNAHRTRSGDGRLITDGEPTVVIGNTRTRAVTQVCAKCGSEFLAVPALVRRGQARYCSRACMYARNRH